jgi:hypothetical protein
MHKYLHCCRQVVLIDRVCLWRNLFIISALRVSGCVSWTCSMCMSVLSDVLVVANVLKECKDSVGSESVHSAKGCQEWFLYIHILCVWWR